MAPLERDTREDCEARRDYARGRAESAASPGDRAEWLEIAAEWQELANRIGPFRYTVIVERDSAASTVQAFESLDLAITEAEKRSRAAVRAMVYSQGAQDPRCVFETGRMIRCRCSEEDEAA